MINWQQQIELGAMILGAIIIYCAYKSKSKPYSYIIIGIALIEFLFDLYFFMKGG